MSQALSTAKVQSVREIKKKAKIKKTNKIVTKIIIFLIIILVIGVFVNTFIISKGTTLSDVKDYFFGSSQFIETEQGIQFRSVDFPVNNSFKILENDENINLVFKANSQDQNYLTQIYKSINTPLSVFNSKGKKVILIISTVDNENNMLSCATNYGDVYTSEEIDVNTCVDLIEQPNTTIIVDYPKTRDFSEVLINAQNKLVMVNPKTLDHLEKSILLILKAMYSDYNDIMDNLDLVNQNVSDLNAN